MDVIRANHVDVSHFPKDHYLHESYKRKLVFEDGKQILKGFWSLIGNLHLNQLLSHSLQSFSHVSPFFENRELALLSSLKNPLSLFNARFIGDALTAALQLIPEEKIPEKWGVRNAFVSLREHQTDGMRALLLASYTGQAMITGSITAGLGAGYLSFGLLHRHNLLPMRSLIGGAFFNKIEQCAQRVDMLFIASSAVKVLVNQNSLLDTAVATQGMIISSLFFTEDPDRPMIKGAVLLSNVILPSLSEEEKELLDEGSSDIFSFIVAKVAFIYVAGEKKEEEIPIIFGEKSREELLNIRNQRLTAGEEKSLRELVSSFEKYGQESSDPLIKGFRGAASEGMQGDIVKGCLSVALKMVN